MRECWATSSWQDDIATIMGNIDDEDLDGLHTCTHTDQCPMNVRDMGRVGGRALPRSHAVLATVKKRHTCQMRGVSLAMVGGCACSIDRRATAAWGT